MGITIFKKILAKVPYYYKVEQLSSIKWLGIRRKTKPMKRTKEPETIIFTYLFCFCILPY